MVYFTLASLWKHFRLNRNLVSFECESKWHFLLTLTYVIRCWYVTIENNLLCFKFKQINKANLYSSWMHSTPCISKLSLSNFHFYWCWLCIYLPLNTIEYWTVGKKIYAHHIFIAIANKKKLKIRGKFILTFINNIQKISKHSDHVCFYSKCTYNSIESYIAKIQKEKPSQSALEI